MKELVLDLITSYEDRICAVEQWITAAHQAVSTAGEGPASLDEEREILKSRLQEILARNCSLRKKDFSRLMANTLADSENSKREIETHRTRVIEGIKGYLDEQKALAVSLKRQLSEEAADGLDSTINSLKISHQDTGHLFNTLRDFHSRLLAFRQEEQEMNLRLKRLVDRGELLQIGDLRQAQAVEARQSRKAERETRRKEVADLLSNFKDYRKKPSLGTAKN